MTRHLQRHFGRLVAARRKTRGMSQAGLAAVFNTTQQTVSEWERGTTTPRFDHLIPLMAMFDITVSELVALEKGRAA